MLTIRPTIYNFIIQCFIRQVSNLIKGASKIPVCEGKSAKFEEIILKRNYVEILKSPKQAVSEFVLTLILLCYVRKSNGFAFPIRGSLLRDLKG